MERINIYIDGGNFHHLVLKKLRVKEKNFDFEGFANFLAAPREIEPMGKRYYVGTVRETPSLTDEERAKMIQEEIERAEAERERTRAAMSEQTSFFQMLYADKWEVKTSKLRRRTEKIGIDYRVMGWKKIRKLGIHEIQFVRDREKGIDVKIATDLLIGAMDNKYDVAAVVSSDSDLVPAIDIVRRRFHKKVEYIGFSIPNPAPKAGLSDHTIPLPTMITRTDVQRVLTEADLRSFIVV